MMRSGIYCIINNYNGKRYVGQSVHVSERVSQHLHALRVGKHPNKRMQADYNKYGDYFNWEILELVDIEQLSEREEYWCNYYHTFSAKSGYNKQRIREQIYVKDVNKYKGIN